MRVLGIDPGVAPAMALYEGPSYGPLVFPPMGIKRKTKVGGKFVERADPDEPKILDIFEQYKPDVVAIEKVSAMPNQGISSTARFMFSAGLVTGIALGKSCRTIRVLPNEWQRAFRMPAGDDISRQICSRLFPWMASQFARVKDHNESDALLIAVYVWHQVSGVELPRW